ncbi:DNA repair ATPase-related [Musa troglodytarum]|uniref:DNA repair ATPase-related n=1 Tax=Musa troglodytarum TaxID=320322 RepID=A0A9E7HWJ3_9LILI|nr:DNA repair ATPase-related [Musa troglodytarum]
MGASRLAIASIVFSLLVAGVWTEEAAIGDEIAEPEEASDSVLKQELELLRSKIEDLAIGISDRTRELKNRDDLIKNLEKIIQEKSATISTLNSQIESLQKKGALDAEELLGKAYTRAAELEKQVDNLRNELETQSNNRGSLEARASEAEKKVQELILKLENLEKTNDEQKRLIRKTERALQVAKEELIIVQLEATTKLEELTKNLVETHWKEHGKPALDVVLQKASDKSAQAQKWLEPHLEIVKTRWVPAVKERWVILVTSAEPYVQQVSTKTMEVYETSKNTIAPHVEKVQKVADPYLQEAKKLSKPYIDQVATVTKPHVEKVRITLKPYTKRVVRVYRKLHKSVAAYHRQVEASIEEHLKKYELTKPLVTKELAWYMASATLALAIFIVYRLVSCILWSKMRKSTQNGQTKHAHRRPKRRHADN